MGLPLIRSLKGSYPIRWAKTRKNIKSESEVVTPQPPSEKVLRNFTPAKNPSAMMFEGAAMDESDPVGD
jgi:hypothetical protein